MEKVINLFACKLKSFIKDKSCAENDIEFFRHLTDKPFVNRWTPTLVNNALEVGIEHLNIKDFIQDEIDLDSSGLVVFSGILIRANRDNKNLIDVHGNLVETEFVKYETTNEYLNIINNQIKEYIVEVITDKDFEPDLL